MRSFQAHGLRPVGITEFNQRQGGGVTRLGKSTPYNIRSINQNKAQGKPALGFILVNTSHIAQCHSYRVPQRRQTTAERRFPHLYKKAGEQPSWSPAYRMSSPGPVFPVRLTAGDRPPCRSPPATAYYHSLPESRAPRSQVHRPKDGPARLVNLSASEFTRHGGRHRSKIYPASRQPPPDSTPPHLPTMAGDGDDDASSAHPE